MKDAWIDAELKSLRETRARLLQLVGRYTAKQEFSSSSDDFVEPEEVLHDLMWALNGEEEGHSV